MKRLLRTIALFLALAMTLSVGALAADEGEDGPRLVVNWLEWDDEGRCYASDDTLSPQEQGDSQLDYQPGRTDFLIFSVLDGDKKTPVVPAGKGIEVVPVDQERIPDGARFSECYVSLNLEDWQDAELTYSYNGTTLTFPITAALPLEGFYTRPEFAQDAFLTGELDASVLEDGTLYFGTCRNDEEHGSQLTEVTPQGDTGAYTIEQVDGQFWKITLTESREEVYVQLEVRIRNTNRNYWNDYPGVSFRSTVTRMCMRGAAIDEAGKIYVPSDYGYADTLQIYPGDYQDMVFCILDGWDEEGNPINVQYIPAEELEFSEGVSAHIFEKDFPQYIENGDELAPCYVELNVEDNGQDFTVTWGEYTFQFDSRLEELGVYSAPEASFDSRTAIGRYGPLHTEEVNYLINVPRNGRTVKSIELREHEEGDMNDIIELEKYADGVYAFHLTAPLGDTRRFTVSVTWEDEYGTTWTDEYWDFWYENYTSIMAGSEPFVDGTGDTMQDFREAGKPFGEVAGKVSTSITLQAGEEQTVYLARAWDSSGEASSAADWLVYAADPRQYQTNSEDLVLTSDSSDATKYTLRCDVPGEYEIRFCSYGIRFLDENGKLMDDEEFSEKFDEFWVSNNLAFWTADWRTGTGTFYNGDGETVEPPYETALVSGEDQSCYPIKVTVEGEAKPIGEIYSDITNENAWYVPAVRYVTNKGMMIGSNGKFDPSAEITGAQFVQIMYNIAGQPGAGSVSFAGVTTQWYAAPITWAAEQGLITDTGDTALDPTANVTREQLALILYNAEGSPEVGEVDLSAFPDADQVSAWALDAMKWAVSQGVINGSDGKLDPTGTTPRSQVAQLLMNYYG